MQYLLRNESQVSKNTIAAEVFIEAWKRTAGEPQIDEALWSDLKACETDEGHELSHESGRSGNSPTLADSRARRPGGRRNARPTILRFRDRTALWRLNQRIRRQGLRERLMANAGLAFVSGRQDLVRQLTYSCLLRRISSLGDLAWIKMLIKTHLSPKWLGGLRRIIKGTA